MFKYLYRTVKTVIKRAGGISEFKVIWGKAESRLDFKLAQILVTFTMILW